MPKLRTAHPDVRNFILTVMIYWIEQTGIDGWRLDVADEMEMSTLQTIELFRNILIFYLVKPGEMHFGWW